MYTLTFNIIAALSVDMMRRGDILARMETKTNLGGPSSMITEQPVLFKDTIYGIQRIPLDEKNLRINSLREREVFSVQ